MKGSSGHILFIFLILISGITAAIGAGFYQAAIIIFVISAAIIVRNRGTIRSLSYYAAGGFVITACTLLPLFIMSSLTEAIVAAGLGAIFSGGNNPIILAIFQIFNSLSVGLIIIPLGLLGGLESFSRERHKFWWIIVGVALYMLKVFFDTGKPLDILFLLTFSVMGFAYIFHHRNKSKMGTLILLLLILSSRVWVSAVPIELTYDNNPEIASETTREVSIQRIFWEQHKPVNCHYYMYGWKGEELSIFGIDLPGCG
jgi:hypothetical protein